MSKTMVLSILHPCCIRNKCIEEKYMCTVYAGNVYTAGLCVQ